MSAPYRHPHYAESSSSHNRQWHEQAAYPDRGYQQDYGYDAYPREYKRDYYAAYPPAHGEYEQRGYNGAQGYGWHDEYSHDQARRYDAAWGSDAYDVQGYGHHMQQSYQPPQLPYEAHGWQPHAPAQYPSNEVWSNAQAVPKHVEGAPAAPKKMRDAAAPPHSSTTFAQEPDWQGRYPSAQPYNYDGIQQQQQRDYHSHAPSAGSSRFQPYIRSSPSAPGTPTHPSMYRPPPMQRLPPAIRAAPRPVYLEQAKKPSRELSDDEARDRKLLVVLDLNGTLVFRAKSGNGRAMDSVRAVPRPFLLCFLQYCLGTSTDTTPKGKQVDAANRPHGSHFWQPAADADATLYEPCSAGRAEVIVWSSAQPVNVDSMVRASFDASIRSQVLRVWARDTLVPHRFYQGKAESIKDLEIVWAELNAFTNDEPSLGRLIAQARDQADQARPDDVPPPSVPTAPKADKKYRGKKNKEKNKLKAQQLKQQHVSAALEAAQAAEEWGPWSAQNTVLVDDSVAKARLQPYNHLLIPEFGKEDAGRMKKFIRQQLAAEGVDVEETAAEGELEYDSDVSIPDEPTTSNGEGENEQATEESKESKKKPIPESRLDDVLLQTIGVLETLRHQSNVSALICSGGIEGYGQPKTALNEQQRKEKVEEGKTPEFWADKGREVCEKLGIEVKAWKAGVAASATAALL